MFNGNRLREARKAAGLTQQELGDAIGVSRSAINKYEKGKLTNPSVAQIAALAEVLHVTPASLSGWEESTQMMYDDEPDTGYALNSQEVALIETFRNLSVRDKQRALVYLFDLEDGKK